MPLDMKIDHSTAIPHPPLDNFTSAECAYIRRELDALAAPPVGQEIPTRDASDEQLMWDLSTGSAKPPPKTRVPGRPPTGRRPAELFSASFNLRENVEKSHKDQ
jgi:hypothetical protein